MLRYFNLIIIIKITLLTLLLPEKMKVIFGPTDHRTIDTMTNLATTCFYQGKYREALILNMQSLEMEKNVKGILQYSI